MEAFGWYKETLIFLKGNKVLMFLVVGLFGGNIYQAYPEVKEIPKQVKEVKAVKKATKNCGCMTEIKKLQRWHR